MAGRLLAAGCAEAPSFETADLVVINTCAIREGAEQKVIGRQGHLARLKAANPGLRVVLTGCAVREPERGGLRRRYPAVDLFLRPDEEPELVDRLGLASAQGAIGVGDRGPVGATTTVGRDGRRRRRRPVGDPCPRHRGGDRRPRLRDQRLAPDHLRLRQDLHLLHRAVQPRTGAQPAVRRHRRRGARPGRGRVPRGDAARPERELVRPRPRSPRRASRTSTPSAGRAAASTSTAAPTSPSSSGPSTACAPPTGRPAIPRLRFVTSHPWDLSDRLIAALADCPSVCEHLHLPVQSGDDAGPASDGPPVHDRALPGAPRPDPRGRAGHHDLDRRHRRVLRRDRGAVPSGRWTCSRTSATTRSSRRPTRRDPGRPRRTSPTTSRPTSSGAG